MIESTTSPQRVCSLLASLTWLKPQLLAKPRLICHAHPMVLMPSQCVTLNILNKASTAFGNGWMSYRLFSLSQHIVRQVLQILLPERALVEKSLLFSIALFRLSSNSEILGYVNKQICLSCLLFSLLYWKIQRLTCKVKIGNENFWNFAALVTQLLESKWIKRFTFDEKRCLFYIHHHFEMVLCKNKSLKSPKSGGELDKARKLTNKYMETHPVRIQAHSNLLD